MAEHRAPQFLGERKHDLEVVDLGQQQLGGLVHPVRPATATAQRAVAVDTRVVDLAAIQTLRALVDVPAQGRGAAEGQFGQHALDLRHGLLAVPFQKPGRVLPQQVDYAEGWAGSLGAGSGPAGFGLEGGALFSGVVGGAGGLGSSHRGHCRTGNQSSGLGVESKCGRRTCK